MHIDVKVMYVVGRVSEARRAPLDWQGACDKLANRLVTDLNTKI